MLAVSPMLILVIAVLAIVALGIVGGTIGLVLWMRKR